MNRNTGLFAFLALVLLVLIMAWATVAEYLHGSEYAGSVFYGSVWFVLLWILMATVGCYYTAVNSLHKRLSVFLLHASFLLILSGALATHLTGRTGQIHLRENRPVSSFFDESTHSNIPLPFSLSLKSFVIEYYPGTGFPSNYVSTVEVTGSRSGARFEREISMNNIMRYMGYRFYQSSFDEDGKGSVLSVNHDTWGIMLSYTGYFLMFFSMLLILFSRRERFRFLLRKLSQKTVLTAALLLILTASAKAAPSMLTVDSLTLNSEQATDLGRLWVDYQGRISPVQTLALDFTAKITGKTYYKDISGEQFLFGWLFLPEKWQHEPVFELKSEELKRIAGTANAYACLADFVDSTGNSKLEPYYRRMYSSSGGDKPEGWYKEAVKLNDKFHLLQMLLYGDLLKIFPAHNENGKLQWYSPNMDIPAQADSAADFTHFLPLYYDALMQNDATSAKLHTYNMHTFQQTNAGITLPSATHLSVELMYNRISIFSLLFKICFSAGSLGLLFFIFCTIRNTFSLHLEKLFYLVLWTVFAVATVGLGLRTYIGGRIPMSNSYETMILLAWLSLLTGILARRYSFLIMVFSFMLAGFTLLVAHISSMNPHITPLVPVLQSPLLSIHVLTIMVAYGLCGFMALNSLTAFAVRLSRGKRTDRTDYIRRLKETSELFMYPAAFLMGAGIFIGAIWANVSWGRYWGWDPKEVWALITFLLMGFTFHGKTLPWFRKPMFYHLFVLIIFLAVLMTYFGVNYMLGGKHSYAG